MGADIPSHMTAVQLIGHGGIEVLEDLREHPAGVAVEQRRVKRRDNAAQHG